MESDSIGEMEDSCRCILRCAVPSQQSRISRSQETSCSTFHSEPGKNKKAAALTNRSALRLPVTKASAIIKACDEIVEGKFCDEFIVDAIQGGARNQCKYEYK